LKLSLWGEKISDLELVKLLAFGLILAVLVVSGYGQAIGLLPLSRRIVVRV